MCKQAYCYNGLLQKLTYKVSTLSSMIRFSKCYSISNVAFVSFWCSLLDNIFIGNYVNQCSLSLFCWFFACYMTSSPKRPWTLRRHPYWAGMALGFFNLGSRTHMSGQIGVPSILGASQNLGDPPLRNSFCCCYEKEWLANYCHTDYSTSTINQTTNKRGGSSLEFPGCVNRLQSPLRS